MNRPAQPSHDAASQNQADAREFDEYARQQEPLLLQAALWATRRDAGLDATAEAEFQAWYAAAPEHARAYSEMADSLAPARALPEARIAALRASVQQPAHTTAGEQITAPAADGTDAAQRPRTAPASRERRSWLADVGRMFPQIATGLAAVALSAGGWAAWDFYNRQPTFAQDYATARGEQREIHLPDGSTLQLDTATQAQVRLYRDHREVYLSDGQAMFTVQADASRPFNVRAGAVRVTVVGTRFSVRHTSAGLDAGDTVVEVESGRVRVAGTAPPVASPAPVELGAGQAISANADGQLRAVTRLSPASVAGWRSGRISFNDTPLADALAELERYGDTGLMVRDPAVGALRLGGSFDARRIDTFKQALPVLLPVRLQAADGKIDIAARP